MLKNNLTSLLAALALAGTAQVSAQSVTLASWTFDTGYKVTQNENDYTYSPDASVAVSNTDALWFNSAIPHILPEEGTGEMTAYSDGRYWQICTGWETQVFRIENTFDNSSVTDYTDPAQHKVYYQASFPTTGYRDIAVDYAIAPGNNTETPVAMAVSTDGGNTWVNAGTKPTSGTWFTYVNSHVDISANNKENVIIRLFPTAGTTNWNLTSLTVTGSKMEALPSAENADINFSWSLGSTTPELAATQSLQGLFSVCELAVGPGLTLTKIGSPEGGATQSLFKPSNNNGSDFTENDALIMTVIPKSGIIFRPTMFSFEASKHGTGGGNIGLEVRRGDKSVMVNDALVPARNNNSDGINFTRFEEAIEGFDASSEALTIILYINKLASNKEYGFANLTLYGVADGQVEAVPVYSFNLKSAVEGAGSLSCAPAGNEFDSGTLLTVSASENFGYHFTSWTDAVGNVVSTDNPYRFEITADTELTANYDINNVYALNLKLEGGANPNMVTFQPEGYVENGVHYYEEGTEVRLATSNNRILTFTNWEDNTTSPTRDITVDSEKNLTATFSAADYIVGWDFYNDQPASERAADYKDESDNAGLLSLHNAEGKTTSWLTRGIGNGSENGKWGARIWKLRSEGNYFEVSFSSVGYSNIVVSAALGISYNSYSINNVQYSIDGKEYKTVGTYELQTGWTVNEFKLPADADNQPKVWVRFMPDTDSPLVGNETDYDGLCIAELFILADKETANDSTAPTLVTTLPADKSDNVSATGSIILTFDEKVKAGNGAATLDGETLKPIESGKSIIYNYAGLSYGTTYTFTVPAGAIVDRSGNAFAGTTLTFTTMERTQPEPRLFDAIVAKDGSGDYTSVQAAIDGAPADRVKPWLIFVKNGEYNEHIDIPKSKPYMHIIGQDRDNTIILDDKLCGGENALHVSVGATVVVNADDCFFENITLENSYGHKQQAGPQALALNTSGDRAIFNNVAMLSYQDTWITTSNSAYRAYVRNSFIEGAVDFIYNSGDLYVENTTLYINRKSGGYIVAPSHAADVKWGYVFNNCTITAPGVPSETDVWLGRPWHNSPKTVFLNTRAEVTIPATGWYETMGGLPALWADYNTVDGNGNPVDLSHRRDTYYKTVDGEKVYGKAKNFLTDEEAAQYTVRNVLSGNDNWEPVIKTEACAAPEPKFNNGIITWDAVPYAICYVILHNDEVEGFVTEPTYAINDATPEEYAIRAVNEYGGLSPKATVYGSESSIALPVDDGQTIIGIYDIHGYRHDNPVNGVNIIKKRDSNGNITVEKLIL
ncbi:MAG: Ig-like domain-containing protein [Duncaniella sp.]|nr:Ig-like domain-containing protein [Duncaniella sp.]